MDKKLLNSFCDKYGLYGIVEGVVWSNENDDLLCTAMTSDKKLFSYVKLEKGSFFKDVDVCIPDTTKLKKLLTSLSDDITPSLDVDSNDKTRVRKLTLEDKRISLDYITGQKDTVNPVPKMKNLPLFTTEIICNKEFVDLFRKSFSAYGDKDGLFTLMMNKKKQKLELVMGYKENNLSDRISIEVETSPGMDKLQVPISFTAKHLFEIFSANSEVESSVLAVSEAGLSGISFEKDGFKSQYYMVKVEVED